MSRLTAAIHPSNVSSTASVASPRGDWIVSPRFDLAFFANGLWPLVVLTAVLMPPEATGASADLWQIGIWQALFLTTPHRWLTHVLVASDADRRAGREWTFVAIAALVGCGVFGARAATGSFVCLGLVSLCWNAWHFASQHSGILRMYSRKTGGGRRWLEVWLLRTFVTYAILRAAPAVFGWTSESPPLSTIVQAVDYAILAVPVVMLAWELSDHPWSRPGKLVYLTSVMAAYTTVMIGVIADHELLLVSMVVATAMFHAIEYIAIVTHYAWRRQTHGSSGPFQKLAAQWVGLLAWYVVLLGALGALADRSQTSFAGMTIVEWWFGLNLWSSLLHFWYDGMIWKLRQPATAKALGV